MSAPEEQDKIPSGGEPVVDGSAMERAEGSSNGPDGVSAALPATPVEGPVAAAGPTPSAAEPVPLERPAEVVDPNEILKRKAAARETANARVLANSRRQTRRSFVVAAGAVAAAYGFHRYLDAAPYREMQPEPLRDAFKLNAAVAQGVFRDHALAPTYPLSRAQDLRVNGFYGLKMPLDPASWRLQLVGMANEEAHPRYTKDVTAWAYRYLENETHEDQGHDTKVDPHMLTAAKMAPEENMDQAEEDENHTGRKPRGFEEAGESDSTLSPGTPGLLLTMDDVVKLPRHELVTQFKCIEGWSQIVHWAGVRMADFIEAYPPAPINGKEPRYVYMETPDGDYYTGYDLSVLRHPQTLLVTEMMGTPLTQFHGAPLRLHMPIKYGYKQIKRIGLIAYTNDRPDDYWTKLGYDWYAGL
jgi:hypothetical protein